MELIGTREAAKKLGVSASRLSRAVWAGNLPEPTRGPGGAFCWGLEDLDRASWHFSRRPYRPEGKAVQ